MYCSTNELSLVIKKVIDQYGISILDQGTRFCAIIDDNVPELKEERIILHRLNQEGLISRFRLAYDAVNEHERTRILKQIESTIYSRYYNSDFALLSISSIAGFKYLY